MANETDTEIIKHNISLCPNCDRCYTSEVDTDEMEEDSLGRLRLNDLPPPSEVEADVRELKVQRVTLANDLQFAQDPVRHLKTKTSRLDHVLMPQQSMLIPIHHLPDDILWLVFEFCCCYNDGKRSIIGGPGRVADNLPSINLSWVCTRWRSLAHDLSALWRSFNICLDGPSKVPLLQLSRSLQLVGLPRLSLLQLYLEKSNPSPLEVSVTERNWHTTLDIEPSRHIEAASFIVDVLAASMERIRVLTINPHVLRVFPARPNFSSLKQLTFTAELQDYETYEVLDIEESSSLTWSGRLLHNAPNMSILHFQNLRLFPQALALPLQALQCFCGNFISMNDVRRLHAVAPQLATLSCTFSASYIDDIDVSETPELGYHLLFSRLRSLTIRDYDTSEDTLTSALARLCAPSLQSFHLQLYEIYSEYWGSQAALKEFVGRSASSLQDLTINGWYISSGDALEILSILPELCRLCLCSPYGGSSAMVDVPFLAFFHASQGKLPNLTFLDLDVDDLNGVTFTDVLDAIESRCSSGSLPGVKASPLQTVRLRKEDWRDCIDPGWVRRALALRAKGVSFIITDSREPNDYEDGLGTIDVGQLGEGKRNQ